MPAQCRLILITGASGAIGGALARAYAQPGVKLILNGRNHQALAAVAEKCEALGAKVTLSPHDLNHSKILQHWLEGLSETRLPDLVILAAGINISSGEHGKGEDTDASARLMNINLQIPIRIAQALAPRMQARGSGQLVFISSLAAWHGLPVTPSYCASKAGIKAYGEALRGALASSGVGVTVVMPGYVESAMAHDMPGPKPWLWSAERAARVIRRGIAGNRARISFPLPLAFGCWCLAMLPAGLSQHLVRWFGYGARP